MRDLTVKQADTRYKISDLIRNRWSPRAFADTPVPKEELQSIFEAARWAASSYNEQPWSYIVASKLVNEQAYEKLLKCLVEFNRTWAKTAPVLALSVAKKHFDRNGNANHHYFHDVGLSVGNLLAEATKRDLYVHQMAGFSADKAVKLFEIPETHEPVAAMAIGYLGDADQLNDDLAKQEKQPRNRKPLTDFVFTESWNQKAYFLD